MPFQDVALANAAGDVRVLLRSQPVAHLSILQQDIAKQTQALFAPFLEDAVTPDASFTIVALFAWGLVQWREGDEELGNDCEPLNPGGRILLILGLVMPKMLRRSKEGSPSS
jgi:hypothetical protein